MEGKNFSKMEFVSRHIGPRESELSEMAKVVGYDSVADFIEEALPDQIKCKDSLKLESFSKPSSEVEILSRLRDLANDNLIYRSYLGQGYYGTVTPAVIQRNILENPGWYTQYTPYQPEISQGRLEALLNYQTMISELTRLELANASLLDEGTAAAEAMSLSLTIAKRKRRKNADTYFVSKSCFAQTIDVVKTRAAALGVKIVVGDLEQIEFDDSFVGVLIQCPDERGRVFDYSEFIKSAHDAGLVVTVAADLLSLLLIKSPGELGADIAIGNTQRFGVPMGFGGPHAAYFAAKQDYQRMLPGRIVGVSKDNRGQRALRLSLQTREQHIRREKATSNICTSQVLLAIMAGMYGVYHGPDGLKAIAKRVNGFCCLLARKLKETGLRIKSNKYFDTIEIEIKTGELGDIKKRAEVARVNLRCLGVETIGLSVDETCTEKDVADLFMVLTGQSIDADTLVCPDCQCSIPGQIRRNDKILAQSVFNSYQSETEFLRYLRRLESKDLSLGTAMIPLGSCTMKLNATTEMMPITWPEFCSPHPFVPEGQASGYARLIEELGQALRDITGFSAVSFQPNAGSQGEYSGLLAIHAYLKAKGEGDRDVCLIPASAHGTNPASAAMAGFNVVTVKCDENGNIDIEDLKQKASENNSNLAALMVTYPSTHGVFEEGIKEVCKIIHAAGGQVYMDGANLNALVGLSKPAELGADVIHINLHKTFAIPHGGGGPGVGPIAVASHLESYLPGHSVVEIGDLKLGAVSSAPYGSAGILPISWVYIGLMGAEGLKQATEVAILNANYIAKRLDKYFPVLYKGKNGLVAHECIVDCRDFKKTTEVEVGDIAKRLMDYGFHAPTVSFPVPGTLMVEPTESESLAELDAFCEAMIAIRGEIDEIEAGKADRESNVLKNAPHTAELLAVDPWPYPYSREKAAYPSERTKEYKFWPAVGRINEAFGDKNLCCCL